VGEKPGKEENARGRSFVGTTGRELNENWLPMIGLDRSSVYVTNTMKCFYPKNEDPPREVVESCAQFHLARELREVNPDVVVLMGSMACSLDPRIDLETHYGFPLDSELFGGMLTLFPMYHPSGELYDFNSVIQIRDGFVNLGKYLRGELTELVDRIGPVEWNNLTHPDEVDAALAGGVFDDIFLDTESSPTGPWSIQFAVDDRTGYVIRSIRRCRKALLKLKSYLLPRGDDPTWGPAISVHNLMYDYDVFEELGIHIPVSRMYDTMWDAWSLGDQPQGLKQLAYRLCGMRMKSFDDLVDPYVYDKRVDWALEASKYTYPKLGPVEVPDGKGGVKLYRPQSMSTKLDRLITDLSKGPVDFSKRWEGWTDEDRLMVQATAGLFPPKSIELVPEREALEYAAKDPVAGMRVKNALSGKMAEFINTAREIGDLKEV
jgi:DNA polymerase